VTPIRAAIEAHQKLIVVPHGAVHHVPFTLLSVNGELLANSHVITYLPSASAMRYLRNSEAAVPRTFFAVGNPADMAYQPRPGMAHVALPPLPGAEIEVNAAARLFDDPRVLLRDEATKRAVTAQMPKYRVVHFATHGHLDPETPQLSGLLLAEGTILNVYELMGIRLDADLVVLSACDTGAGEVTGGNDIIGLSHAFLGAGARALVVSLWPVNDRSATVTMKRMYEHMGQGVAPAEALRAAQLELRSMMEADLEREYLQAAQVSESHAVPADPSAMRGGSDERPERPPDHPLHWAPFVYIGVAGSQVTAT
jgi:CHAT domain-containing protein